ncbi:MAG: tRNA (N(6)-L-threonylcarbamoyladenosine(37)-C(2))-methylthiotransferase MtaB, partial [Candidatus Aminicenantes bacterium]|nr:tRNA (N(6)-L-threonylcarbamoyladenosine(37)-C(2))-methylthiotransferase MtaB [Candidatus Aminicenantes bacterium]
MTTFSIQSFGCRVNQAEAFSWANDLQENGLVYIDDNKKSDLVLVNTCTLTSRADRDVRSFLRKMARENPGAGMILTGCYVDRLYSQIEEDGQILKLIPNEDKNKLVDHVLSLYGQQKIRSQGSYRSRALIKVQDGCDYKCSFCIIPSVRGQNSSTAKALVIKQIKNAINKGYFEIVLTGVHLCLYGLDLNPRMSLLDLLKEIECLEGLGRMRL